MWTEASALSFNSRPLKEVDQGLPDAGAGEKAFQFTTSQGGRLGAEMVTSADVDFQFTTSQGGRPDYRVSQDTGITFQFTTSQGGRR